MAGRRTSRKAGSVHSLNASPDTIVLVTPVSGVYDYSENGAGQVLCGLLTLCSVGIAWFRYKGGIDPVSAICRAAVMLAASVAIYELAHTMQHKTITGLHHAALSLAMLVAWFALIFTAAAPTDSVNRQMVVLALNSYRGNNVRISVVA